jgi:Flp pilus assembly pilin Flp
MLVPEPRRGLRPSPLRRLRRRDDGMSTVEYAIGTIAAAAFAVVLYTVLTGDSVVGALTAVVEHAISVKP